MVLADKEELTKVVKIKHTLPKQALSSRVWYTPFAHAPKYSPGFLGREVSGKSNITNSPYSDLAAEPVDFDIAATADERFFCGGSSS